ncbi:MarR family winged helix-turn-helix transcriptional regulator [Pseudoroseicyclus aestuarii]|uniref:DNA-binding MarR family transcriptional regulator n=1 Tax=Pseudoroseicyclus aestuarii TaxID=1795041 RepID=A0A318SZ37_9RHOB|nr:MarR family transcriptional regulator [Pseudoroseicyclus aestuarii]PYE81264.1 DNA-binding MarR family transcriptional regulator [Pseudoroseicyclus aestuarii]
MTGTERTDALDLERQVCFPLYAASNLVNRAYRPILSPLGLTYPQYLVMLVLWQDGCRSVGALGERLYLDSGTLTPMLKRLEAQGLVRRVRDNADERRVNVSLTDEGAALRERAQSVPATMFGACTNWQEDQLHDLRHAVNELIDALNRRDEAAKPEAVTRRKPQAAVPD